MFRKLNRFLQLTCYLCWKVTVLARSVPIVLDYYVRCSWLEFLSRVFWRVFTPSGRCRNLISNRSRQSLVPCQNFCILSPCTVCSSSLSTRVTHYFVRITSESPYAKHLCASHSFLLLPAVTSSFYLLFHDTCHLDTQVVSKFHAAGFQYPLFAFCHTMNSLRHCPPTIRSSCAVWKPFIWFAFERRVA